MEKYHLYVVLKEDMVDKLQFSDYNNDIDELIERLEKILALYKKKKKIT